MIEKKDFKKLSPFKGWTLQNFPFIEADFDAITEYQLYCKIVEYLNKIIYNQKLLEDSDNELVEAFNNLKAYIDEYLYSIPDFEEAINNINSRLNELVIKVNDNTNSINDLNIKIDSEVQSLEDRLVSLINQNYNILKSYIDNEVLRLEYEISHIEIGNIIIYDPTTGTNNTLQTVINNIAQLSNKDGLTASEFDTLELTASGFDAYQITAYEFDSQGKIILT